MLPSNVQRRSPVVLSIQSHVVCGHVGNAAATLPLQLKGIEVWPLNVLQFTHHLGYGAAAGHRLDASQVQSIVTSLEEKGLLGMADMVLTGYLGNSEVIALLARAINKEQERRKQNQARELLLLCDPVCGDNGKLYVDDAVPAAYTSGDSLLSLATIATPNGFEASFLTGIEITSVPSAIEAAAVFHSRFNVKHLVITSFTDDKHPDQGSIAALVSSWTETRGQEVAVLRIPLVVGAQFSGTGDAFAAVLLGEYWNLLQAMERTDGEEPTTLHSIFTQAVETSATTLQFVLERTLKVGIRLPGVPQTGWKELALVSCIDELRNPPKDGRIRADAVPLL